MPKDREATAPGGESSDVAATLAARSAGLIVEELPASVRARIIDGWAAARPRLGDVAVAGLRRFVAELVGSVTGPLVAGARGGGAAQVAHRWPEGTVVWSLTAADPGWRIDGQLLVDEPDEPWRVSIRLDDRDIGTVDVDELGEFQSPVVLDEPRSITLELIGRHDVVRCGPIGLDGPTERR